MVVGGLLAVVNESSDIVQVKQFLREKGADVPLIAKVEKHEAVDDIDSIIAEANGIEVRLWRSQLPKLLLTRLSYA